MVNMDGKKVSIIIPVYNVEKYIEQCLDSVIHQTYKNLEIIIVNDGSSDNSYSICEKYANSDNRFVLITQQNGGLAKARNEGIKASSGDIISFVDSDDFLDEQMIEKMVGLYLETAADIVCTGYDEYDDEKSFFIQHIMPLDSHCVLSGQEARKLLLFDCFYRCFAWNKIYSREIFEGELFPEGVLYEDIEIMHNLFEKSKFIAVINKPLYHYRIRKDSITKSTRGERVHEILNPIRNILSQTTDAKSICGCIRYYLFFFNDYILSDLWDDEVYREFRYLFKRNFASVLGEKNISFITKMRLLLLACNHSIYAKMYLRYLKVKSEN